MSLKPFLLPLFLLLGTIVLMAQANFRPGYIVKTSGDTLAGLLDYRGTTTLSQICSFKSSTDAEVVVYKPEDLRGYQFDNGKTLTSKKIDSTQYFLEQLFNGCVQFYLLKTELSDERYFVSKDDAALIELIYTEEKLIRNDQIYFNQSGQHIITLKNIMKDQHGVYPQIEQMDRPEALNLVLLAKAYQI